MKTLINETRDEIIEDAYELVIDNIPPTAFYQSSDIIIQPLADQIWVDMLNLIIWNARESKE